MRKKDVEQIPVKEFDKLVAKTQVVPSWHSTFPDGRKGKPWTVLLQIGCQGFHLDYRGTKREAKWMAKQLSTALAKLIAA